MTVVERVTIVKGIAVVKGIPTVQEMTSFHERMSFTSQKESFNTEIDPHLHHRKPLTPSSVVLIHSLHFRFYWLRH